MRDARLLLIPLALHAAFAGALWSTGSFHGTWTFECAVGATAWDLAHGRNPAFTWSDYYDSWTSGYLLWAWLEAPLTRLPWDPIWAVKAISLATTTAVGTLGWLFLREVTGRAAALLGASALILCPPTLWFFALHGGDYHYTELVPALALFWRLARRLKAPSWGARGAMELGLLAGIAVATSLGALLPVALSVVVFVRLRPRRLLRRATWLALPAALIGASPLIIKLLHRPFGLPRAPHEFSMPYFSAAVGPPLGAKLAALPAGLARHIGFADSDPSLAWIDSLFSALVLAVVLVALVGGLRSFIRGSRQGLLAALPGLYAAGLLVIYLILPLSLPPRSVVSNFRDVRWLGPLLAGAALAAPMLLARLRLLPLAALPPLLALLGWIALVPWSRVQPRLPYAGTCHQMQGMYAGKVLPPARDGVPLAPELCDGFGDETARSSCALGRAASVAVYAQARDELRIRSSLAGLRGVESTCAALSPREQRTCFRQLGWALVHARRNREQSGLALKRACSVLRTTQRQAWCREGLGYWFVDELGGWPERLDRLLEGLGEPARNLTAAGVGARLGWAYRDEADVARACGAYAGLSHGAYAACLEGAASVRPGG